MRGNGASSFWFDCEVLPNPGFVQFAKCALVAWQEWPEGQIFHCSRKYDFSLEFDCIGCAGMAAMLRNLPAFAGRGGDAPASQEAAPDPGSGLPNIFAALEKQLGLKLVRVKDVLADILVVDSADKVRSEN